MKTIDLIKLKELLSNVKGATPVTISTVTEVKLPKSEVPTQKLSRINGMVGTSYSAGMERVLGEYIPKPRTWGQRLSDCPALVTHKGNYYLTLRVKKRLSTVFLQRHGSLLKVVGRENFPDIKDRESVLEVRDFNLSHIRRISIGKEVYQIAGNTPSISV